MNASGLGLPFVRRRETHHVIDENALQHLLLNEKVWSRALLKGRTSKWNVFLGYLQSLYEKSHKLLPLLILTVYSIIGGSCFWWIEYSPEQEILHEKGSFIQTLKEDIVSDVLLIDTRLRQFNDAFANSSFTRGIHYRAYRKFALNRLSKSVYWYTVSLFYLTEHETHKSTLRPLHPGTAWKMHEGNLGRVRALRNYTEQLALRCWELGIEGASERWNEFTYRARLNDSIADYDVAVGLNNVMTPIWTFWNALFLAVTTYTTIGYGNITAKTRLGQLFAMVYAGFGIPLFLMILHKLGRIFLNILERIWNWIMRVADSVIFVSDQSRQVRLAGEQRISEMPLLLAIGIAFGWMFLCAAIFLKFEEDWDYFKSFYFFFCSLTTIGYGDVTPTNSEDMFLIYVLIVLGLSLVSMCINVIQLKLEKFFEEVLLMLMEEYSTDLESSTLERDKIGFMEMWRAWKQRKNRLHGGLAPAREAAGRAGQNIAKVIPFARRGRYQLIEELQQQLKQRRRRDKATQTELFPMFLPLPVREEPWTETSDVDSYSFKSDTSNQFNLLIPDATICGPSPCRSQPTVAQAETSYCSSSDDERNSVHSREVSVPSPAPKLSSASATSSRVSSASAKSAPCPSPSRFPVDYDPNRRWTFVGAERAFLRGAPRGLVVPYMYTRTQPRGAGPVPKTEMERILAELQECRNLNTPVSSMRASSSSEASVFN